MKLFSSFSVSRCIYSVFFIKGSENGTEFDELRIQETELSPCVGCKNMRFERGKPVDAQHICGQADRPDYRNQHVTIGTFWFAEDRWIQWIPILSSSAILGTDKNSYGKHGMEQQRWL